MSIAWCSKQLLFLISFDFDQEVPEGIDSQHGWHGPDSNVVVDKFPHVVFKFRRSCVSLRPGFYYSTYKDLPALRNAVSLSFYNYIRYSEHFICIAVGIPSERIGFDIGLGEPLIIGITYLPHSNWRPYWFYANIILIQITARHGFLYCVKV